MSENRLNSPKAERAAIGCAILDPTLASELRSEWFFDLRYRKACEELLDLATEGKPIDEVILAERLAKAGLEDAATLVAECVGECPGTGSSFSYWRTDLVECLTLRHIHKAAANATFAVTHGDRPAGELLEDFERDALAIRPSVNGTGLDEADLRATIHGLIAEYEAAATGNRLPGLATGFYDLDKLLGGIKPQQLIIIAARPSVGKTSFACNVAERVAILDNIPTGFFSLEMSASELVHRLSCSFGHVDGVRLNEGAATEADLKKLAVAHGRINKAPLRICERGGLTLAQLSAQARRMVQRHGIQMLIVDYLGLLRTGEKGRSRYEDTTTISNGLKLLAKELNMPVIALAQLNRDTEREGRSPRLADLRDSGAIEQDADAVILLHRKEDQTGDDQEVSAIVAKNRCGRIGKADLIFRRNFTRFESKTR